jgi:hypothetical protein
MWPHFTAFYYSICGIYSLSIIVGLSITKETHFVDMVHQNWCHINFIFTQWANNIFLHISDIPKNVTVISDSSSHFARHGGRPLHNITCQANCRPLCTYTWWIWPDSLFETGTTLFARKKFTFNSNKRFKCVATNKLGKAESRWITIHVMSE